MNKIRLGIIGLGNIGSMHAQNIITGEVPEMELTALCDTAPARKEFAAKNFPDVKFFDNSDELIKNGMVDAVLVAVPHYDHPSIVIAALENGLNVITEKPAGVYTKQVLEMNDAAEKSGKLFSIMYNQRTNPIYAKIKKMVENGELGAIKRVQWTITDWYRPQSYHDSSTWCSTRKTEGGGDLINQNTHQLDLWQWMFGMPDKIMSHVSFGKYYDIEVEDDVTAFMQYDNGMTGVYITSIDEAPGTNRLEIACDMGQLIVEDNKLIFKRNEVSEREFNKNFKGVFGAPEVWNCEIPVEGAPGEQHIGILRDFAHVLKNGGKLLAHGCEGINGLTILNAIHYSAWTGKWVDIKNFQHKEFHSILQEKIAKSTIVKKEQQITANTEGTYRLSCFKEGKKMKKVCIVGCGNISEIHRSAINKTDNAYLYAACDVDNERLKSAEKEWGVIGYNNFDDVINDENVDSVHICTPHYLHYEMIKKAINAGKQIVCEKPITMTAEELDNLLSDKASKDICVVFQNRLNQSVQVLKNITETKELGEIISMRAFITWYRNKDYYNSASWRGRWATEGGGTLINQAIHTLDYFNYIAGGIESVRADMSNFSLQNVIEVEDTVSAYLKLKNNADGIFFATNAYKKDSAPFVEVTFENGEAVYNNGKLFVNGEKRAEDIISQTGKTYWGTGHDLLIKNFYDKNSFFNVHDAENTMRAVFAMYESAKSGKEIRL